MLFITFSDGLNSRVTVRTFWRILLNTSLERYSLSVLHNLQPVGTKLLSSGPWEGYLSGKRMSWKGGVDGGSLTRKSEIPLSKNILLSICGIYNGYPPGGTVHSETQVWRAVRLYEVVPCFILAWQLRSGLQALMNIDWDKLLLEQAGNECVLQKNISRLMCNGKSAILWWMLEWQQYLCKFL